MSILEITDQMKRLSGLRLKRPLTDVEKCRLFALQNTFRRKLVKKGLFRSTRRRRHLPRAI